MKDYISLAKQLLITIWSKLKLYLVIPPLIVFIIFLLILALCNLFGLRELGLRWMKGQVPEYEQKELSKKLTEIVNHFAFIFYILILSYYVFVN